MKFWIAEGRNNGNGTEELLSYELLVALAFLVKYKTSLESSPLHLMMYKGV
jgi:hypothetical protein